MRARAAVAALALLAAACTASEPAGSGSSPSPARPTCGTGAPGGWTAPLSPGGGATPGPGPGTSGATPSNTLPLTVTLNPTCARYGDAKAATAVTVARAELTFIASYNDTQTLPDYATIRGDSNRTGAFTWRWVIRPGIAYGTAVLAVVASREGRNATRTVPFRLAATC